MNDKRVRPTFMGVGYHDEVDADMFIEVGREHGVIDLTEEQQAAHKKRLDEKAMSAQLKRALATSVVGMNKLNDGLEMILKVAKEDPKGVGEFMESLDKGMKLSHDTMKKIRAKVGK